MELRKGYRDAMVAMFLGEKKPENVILVQFQECKIKDKKDSFVFECYHYFLHDNGEKEWRPRVKETREIPKDLIVSIKVIKYLTTNNSLSIYNGWEVLYEI